MIKKSDSLIIGSPYAEPSSHWSLPDYKRVEGRRAAEYNHFRRNGDDKVVHLDLANTIRARVKSWVAEALKGGGGVSRVTMDLLNYWQRAGREHRLFFAQLEAAHTVIFLTEARSDYRQGLEIPTDAPDEATRRQGYTAFERWCCKMATGTGKTTVMGMLAAWSILNKVANRNDARYSDAILVVCPNVTIRERLNELNPQRGNAGIYRTRDLVPPQQMSNLAQGKVLVTNWHLFEPQTAHIGGGARVAKIGRLVNVTQTFIIGDKTQTLRDKHYITEKELRNRALLNRLKIVKETHDGGGNLKSAQTTTEKYIETDGALVRRVLGRDLGNKGNILVFNDEAHHAYRLHAEMDDTKHTALDIETLDTKKETDEYYRGATVWIDGLDKVHKVRGINHCIDFSATPYFLGRVGNDEGKVFPWVVSDFGLADAIESGLVKAPQLAARDNTGGNNYYDLWQWILEQLRIRGQNAKQAPPNEVLNYAARPITLMAHDWQKTRREWREMDESRSPVLIIVCKNTKIAKAVYEWVANDTRPDGIASLDVEELRNRDEQMNTIRIDTEVLREIESGNTKTAEARWMRFTLGTVGKLSWPEDEQGRPLYPPEFEELAEKLQRPKHPPGRDVRCIVSVSMLTEGWDCNTVTHIVGLRPFMSQLLCEQVVGRGLRRVNYEADQDDMLQPETATVFGVPFRTIPIMGRSKTSAPVVRNRVHALERKREFEIKFPRVERYRREIKSSLTVDFENLAPYNLATQSANLPTQVEVKETSDISFKPEISAPGSSRMLDENAQQRLQKQQFRLAVDLTRQYAERDDCIIPTPVLFQQILRIVLRYCEEKIQVPQPHNILGVFRSPHYREIRNRLLVAIKPDTDRGETPELPCYEQHSPEGTTAQVDFFSKRQLIEVKKSHVNAVASDSQLEREVAFALDNNPKVKAFVKNEGLGFRMHYYDKGDHDYFPDYIVSLENGDNLILEPKGYDLRKREKREGALRWVEAVNADGQFGRWHYEVISERGELERAIVAVLSKYGSEQVPDAN